MHVNGAFHCTVRYRQLYNLFDQLRREFGPHCLPPFPPKKLLPLTPSQTEERRAQLEKFIQLGMYILVTFIQLYGSISFPALSFVQINLFFDIITMICFED